MASDDVWILGIHMTKFGKHPDKDLTDLSSEAVLGALADGGVTMKDMGVIGAGNLLGGGGGAGQALQKQLGQTGIPVYNVSNACATGATALRVAVMAVKAGECDMGLAFGVEKLSGAGLLAGGTRQRGRRNVDPVGSLRCGGGGRRPHRHRDHARRVRTDRHGIRSQVRRHQLRALRQNQREESRPLHPQPAGGVHQADEPGGDYGRRDDRLPQHAPDVLGQLRRCGGGRCRERVQAQDACPWNSRSGR